VFKCPCQSGGPATLRAPRGLHVLLRNALRTNSRRVIRVLYALLDHEVRRERFVGKWQIRARTVRVARIHTDPILNDRALVGIAVASHHGINHDRLPVRPRTMPGPERRNPSEAAMHIAKSTIAFFILRDFVLMQRCNFLYEAENSGRKKRASKTFSALQTHRAQTHIANTSRDWAVDQIADLFRITPKVKTQQVAGGGVSDVWTSNWTVTW